MIFAPSALELHVAERIAAIRAQTGYTLGELARRCGLSAAYLSRVENAKTAVTLATLVKLADALDIDVNALLETKPTRPSYVVRRKGEGLKVKFKGRAGLSLRLLADEKSGKMMEPLIGETKPIRAGSSQASPPISHLGEEFILILEGALRFTYGKKEFVLQSGDSIYFDASVPHVASGHPRGSFCRFVAVVVSPDYQHHGNISRIMER